MANTSVMLVDDHPLFRQGLRRVLEAQEEIEVIMEVADGVESARSPSKTVEAAYEEIDEDEL